VTGIDTLPADLYGRGRTDRLITNLTAFRDAYTVVMDHAAARGKLRARGDDRRGAEGRGSGRARDSRVPFRAVHRGA
jgi:hypothetical protein